MTRRGGGELGFSFRTRVTVTVIYALLTAGLVAFALSGGERLAILMMTTAVIPWLTLGVIALRDLWRAVPADQPGSQGASLTWRALLPALRPGAVGKRGARFAIVVGAVSASGVVLYVAGDAAVKLGVLATLTLGSLVLTLNWARKDS